MKEFDVKAEKVVKSWCYEKDIKWIKSWNFNKDKIKLMCNNNFDLACDFRSRFSL